MMQYNKDLKITVNLKVGIKYIYLNLLIILKISYKDFNKYLLNNYNEIDFYKNILP